LHWAINELIEYNQTSPKIYEYIERARVLGWADQYAKDGKWFKEAVEAKAPFNLGGWEKNLPAGHRRSFAIHSRPKKLSQHKKYISAGRALQALSNVTQDMDTKKIAKQDAEYFFNEGKKFDNGGGVGDSGAIYSLSENMSDTEYDEKYSKLSKKQKDKVDILIRLGDIPKLALATILLSKEIDENSDTWNLHRYSKGGGVGGSPNKIDTIIDQSGGIALTILDQLGGAGRLKAMTGAYNFIRLPNGVSFRIKNAKANYIKITITSMDLYDLEISRLRGDKQTLVYSANGLYDDMLKPAIEKATGMYLSMANGGPVVEQESEIAKRYVDYYMAEDMAFIFDKIGMDMPTELEGEYFETEMDDARTFAEGYFTENPDEMTDKFGNPFAFDNGGGLTETIELWYVTDNNDHVKNISTTPKEAGTFLEKSLKLNGKMGYRQVPKKDYNEGKVTTSTIRQYRHGGYVGKGELVWRKLSSSEKINFLYENFTPQITPRSQELLVGKTYNFLPKNVKDALNSKYANVEVAADGKEIDDVVKDWKAVKKVLGSDGGGMFDPKMLKAYDIDTKSIHNIVKIDYDDDLIVMMSDQHGRTKSSLSKVKLLFEGTAISAPQAEVTTTETFPKQTAKSVEAVTPITTAPINTPVVTPVVTPTVTTPAISPTGKPLISYTAIKKPQSQITKIDPTIGKSRFFKVLQEMWSEAKGIGLVLISPEYMQQVEDVLFADATSETYETMIREILAWLNDNDIILRSKPFMKKVKEALENN